MLLFCIVAISISNVSYSQSDFRKGFVITTANDTLRGLVDYREGSKPYQSCSYRKTADHEIIDYGPKDLIGYGFYEDKYFQSRFIHQKGLPGQDGFMEVLVRGLVSLYKYEDFYFAEKRGDSLIQLLNEKEVTMMQGKRVLKESNQYIGILNILMFDCREMQARIQKLRLDERNLTHLVVDYNKCRSESIIVYKARKPWVKAMAGIAGGINISQLSYLGGAVDADRTFEVLGSPILGFTFTVSSPRLSERFSFESDLFYLNSTYYDYEISTSATATGRDYITIEIKQLKVPLGVKFTFPERRYTPYLMGGLSTTVHLESSSSWTREVESYNVVSTYFSESVPINSNQVGLWGGIGLSRIITPRIDGVVELRYEQTDGVTPIALRSVGLNSTVKNFQLLIGIRFK